MNELDNDWEAFLSDTWDGNLSYHSDINSNKEHYDNQPKECSPLHISTQTKIAYLNQTIDIHKLFLELYITPYYKYEEGIIKKMIKYTTYSKKNKATYENKLKHEYCPLIETIVEYDTPTRKSQPYKCIQKLSAGLTYKNIYKFKLNNERRAFYNCIALILRLNIEGVFKEYHVKVFNTGKMELPGIKETKEVYYLLNMLIQFLKIHIPSIHYDKNTLYNVLINSNFNCGYCIDRQKITQRLKEEYNIISMYDPCQYPGVQCKFYYNHMNTIQNGVCMCNNQCNKKGSGYGKNQCKEISFMIFRTGSILIVGNCNEDELKEIYEFLVNLFKNEYDNICLPYVEHKKKNTYQYRKEKKKIYYIEQ